MDKFLRHGSLSMFDDDDDHHHHDHVYKSTRSENGASRSRWQWNFSMLLDSLILLMFGFFIPFNQTDWEKQKILI